MSRAAVVVMVGALAMAACERRADVPPGQPTEGVPAGQPVPAPQPGVTAGAGSGSDTIDVALLNRDGQPAGAARLIHRDDGMMLTVRAEGLTPDQQHGIHIHGGARCDPPSFESAGSHFAPFARQHGLENPQGPHAGDLPNLRANAQGTADTTFTTTSVRLRAGAQESVLRPGGLALVVHAQPDDQRTDPSGNSGDRILCGVIGGL